MAIKIREVNPKDAERIKREIESSQEFRAIESQMRAAAKINRERLKKKMADNAEYQRRKNMSAYEKARGAIDRLAGSIKIFNREAKGKELTHEQCYKEARRIAKRALGEKD